MDKLKQLLSSNKRSVGNFKKFSVWLFFVFVLLLPLTVGAQNDLNINTAFSGSGLPTTSLTFIIVRILQIFFGVLGVIAVFIIMYAGFIWMTSQGDPNKVQKAKQIMTNAVIGLIIIFSAFGIATFIMNVLRGAGGGGVGGGGGWGGRDDFGRSAIGAGPIESVYPAPNATNIPINTSIIVTFKQPINPSSICNLDSSGMCDTAKTEAIEICQLSEDNSACLADGDFVASAFDAVKVATSTDSRTFVFTPNKFLGLEDNQIRIFGVTLKNAIKFRDRDDSIFSGWRDNNYPWSFKTNGKVDLTPPEVAKTDMYPWPDNSADTYQETAPAIAGTSVLTFTAGQIAKEKPVAVNGEYFKGQALKVRIDSTTVNLPPAFVAFFETQSGFNASSSQTITISLSISGDAQEATFSNHAVLGLSKATWPISESGNIINTDAGFSITATGRFVAGSSFSFSVSPAVTGSVFSIASTSTPDRSYDFVFVDPAVGYGNTLTKIVTSTDGTRGTKNYFTISETTQAKIIEAVNANNPLVTASAGDDSTKVNFTARVSGNNNIVIQTTPTSNSGLIFSASSLAGTDRVMGRTIVGRPDAYNNHIFRVTFTEAINPINIENYFIVRARLVNGGAEITVPFDLVLTNQYKTVELVGRNECGENSCGKKIYCWFDPASTTESAVEFRVEVKPATIKYATDNTNPAWCSSWGGSAVAGQDGGRCKMSVTVGTSTTDLYYSQANTFDGVVDLANNSFNGNFNKAYNRQDVLVGKAEGPKGTGNGQSQKTSYYLANAYLNSSNVFTYTPNDSYGDDFAWEFFVSPLIDNTAPIIQSVLPVGDQSYGVNNNESLGDPVKITFNTLMRYSTLKPGWGYGTSTNDKNYHIRYLALNTLTSNANPVGYWSAGSDLDVDGDQMADLTQARINHNPLDNSVSYGPLAGSGLESINQNCYLPGMGPNEAGKNTNSCSYTTDGYSGCVNDSGVVSTNPSSYGYMNCSQIIGAVECSGSCRVHNATSIESEIGSWIITKDKSTIINSATGSTGCCFGRCFNQ